MNRQEMRETVRLLIGETIEDYTKDTEIHTQLNVAQLKLATDLLMSNVTYETFSTISYLDVTLAPTDSRREGRYPLPLDFLSMQDIKVKNGSQWLTLERLSHDKFEAVASYASGGVPTHYRIALGAVSTSGIPGDIWMWPYPDAAYLARIEHYQKPTTMTADTDVSELPESAHLGVCYHAAMIVSRKGKDRTLMSEMAALWTEEKQSLLEYVGRQDLSGSMEVDDVYGF